MYAGEVTYVTKPLPSNARNEIVTVKPDVLLMATLQTSAATLVI